MSAEHPILARFAQLQDQWRAFHDDAHARVLVWRARPDELELVQCFLAGDAHVPEENLLAPRVRLLTAAFEAPEAHGETLARTLHGGEYVAAVGSADRDDAMRLCTALEATRAQAAPPSCEEPLAAWLAPVQVSDAAAYRGWLARLAHVAPASLRFVVVDSADAADHVPLQAVEPLRVRLQVCNLDMPEALRSLVLRADDGGEGSRYRLLMLQLSEAVAGRDGALAERIAVRATELSLAAGWPSLAVAAQMMLAAGYGRLDDGISALRTYVEAERLATITERAEQAAGLAQSDRCGARLRLCAKLGQAAQLLAERAYDRAAPHYAACAQLASQLPDPRFELDGHRLAASCYALLGARPEAFRHGVAGLAVAEAMDPSTRATSTLPFLAAQLQRMSGGAHEASVEARLTALLGADWRSNLPT